MKTYLLLSALLLIGSCAHPSAEGVRPIAIAGARLEPGGANPPIDYSIVIVEDGKFRAVGPQTSVPLPKEADVVDGLNQTIVADGNPIAVGQPANLTLKGPKGVRTMREGKWQQ
ncbi:hypothetical protein F183_A00730 [Bryobacterales bacterium F-183]|nr:hypothetical protein F183_A00730 [Bryobacterales bacterium F-183]